MSTILALVVAYVGSRAIFYLIGFTYDPFRDSFDLGKWMTGLVVFIAVFLLFKFLIDKGRGSRGF
jgi:hypothetical protein